MELLRNLPSIIQHAVPPGFARDLESDSSIYYFKFSNEIQECCGGYVMSSGGGHLGSSLTSHRSSAPPYLPLPSPATEPDKSPVEVTASLSGSAPPPSSPFARAHSTGRKTRTKDLRCIPRNGDVFSSLFAGSTLAYPIHNQ